MHQHRPSKIEGAGNAGCSPHPQPRTQSKKAYEQFTTGTPKHSGIPRAMVLTASFELSLVIGAFLPPSQAAMRKHHRPLDVSVETSGPHDFTVRRHVVRLLDTAASIASRTQRP
jgi:hypothetical protein